MVIGHLVVDEMHVVMIKDIIDIIDDELEV